MSVLSLNNLGGAGGGGVTDHGALTGLVPDDDHTQYALKAGRSGGQLLFGGTDPGDSLVLSSTSDATKGNIVLSTRSIYQDDLAILGPRLGIGTLFPDEPIHTRWDIDGNVGIKIENPNAGTLAVCRMIVKPDVGAGGFVAYGSGFTADGSRKPTSVSVVANLTMTNGLSLVSRSVTADMSFYAGGYQDPEERMRLRADGALVLLQPNGGKLFGGDTTGGGDLFLQGRDDAALGLIKINSPVIFGPYEPSGEAYGFSYTETESFTSNFIGGGLNFSGNITFSNSTFIYESFRGAPTITSAVAPGFAAYTVLQALPQLHAGSGAGHNPLSPLVLNAGPRVRNAFAGTRTVGSVAAVNFSGTLNGAVNGAVMNATNWRGMTVQPGWDTVAGSTIDFGTIIGVACNAPAQALFSQSLGTERMAAYYGLQMQNPTISNAGGTAPVAAVRSLVNDGTNKWFLLNAGTANSEFGNSDIHFNDAGGIVLGTGDDVRLEWDNANTSWNWNPAVGEDLEISFGVVSGKPTYLFEAETFGVSEVNYTQIRFGFDRFAFGQTGTIGNQVGVWTAGPRTAEVGGGWSDYLLTQGGSLTIPNSFSMSDVAAWTINSISLANPATSPQPSIASLDTFVVGAMTTSNPGVSVTERSAMRVTGRTKLRGSVQYPPINPSALSAGDNDDWAGLLTGSPNNNGRFWARVTGNVTTSVVTGIDSTAAQDGDTFELTNIGTDTILLADQDTGSSAANRIITGLTGSYSLAENETATIRYDATTARWRVTTPAGAVLPLASQWKYDNNTTMADPGSTFFRVNAVVGASPEPTAIAISDITFKEGDASALIGALGAGDQMYLQNHKDGAERMVFDITSVVDNTTWFQINGTVNTSGSAFSDGKEFFVVAIYA
ncbi:MAG: hypothetical protein GY794_16265 [bacterium]|nr:hypothetical protein [bacterium]